MRVIETSYFAWAMAGIAVVAAIAVANAAVLNAQWRFIVSLRCDLSLIRRLREAARHDKHAVTSVSPHSLEGKRKGPISAKLTGPLA